MGGRHFEGMFPCRRHVNFGNRISACVWVRWFIHFQEQFREGAVCLWSGEPCFHFFRRAPAASSSVQSTSCWVAAPLYFVREGGTFYSEMTSSYKTDQTQRACMLDYVARHPSVYALPDEFSSCFASAECLWAAEATRCGVERASVG